MEYVEYQKFIEHAITKDNMDGFKSNSVYNGILEHVSSRQGLQYLQEIEKRFALPIHKIRSFCALNDRVGTPSRVSYADDLTVSPTSLRYIFHALLILEHVQKKGISSVKIVEVGCGYGGLVLAINFFAKYMNVVIDSYDMIDLPEPLLLQKKYLAHFDLDFPIYFHSAETYGAGLQGTQYYLISNYCFSEITHEYQTKYIETLFPKVEHGFMTWNHIDVYNFGKKIEVEDEYPLTGAKNKYVRF